MVKVIVFQCLVLGLMKQATSVAQAVNRSINNAEKPKIAWCVNWNHYLSICSGNSNICCSVTQSCLNICDPVDGSTPGFPVLYHFPEFAETHVHQVSDAIQPLLSYFATLFFCLQSSQHQGLFQWDGYSYQVAKVLELQLQHQSFQWIIGFISFRID